MNKWRRFWVMANLLMITGCNAPNGLLPGPLFSSNFPPPGPPNYQQGIMDGCRTAIGASASGFYALMYNKVYYDVDKAINDTVYYKAWKDGYFYCKYEHDKGPE